MRVSDATFYRNNKTHIGKAAGRLAKAQEMTLTGRRAMRPSDDPVHVARAMKERAQELRSDQRSRSVTAGKAKLDTQDQALGDLGEVLRRAEELAVQAANDTLNANDRAGIAREIDELRQSAIALGNAQVGGRFVFGGFNDDAPPFDGAGAFTGTNDVRELEVGDGLRIADGVTAATAFGLGGATDVFAVLEDLRVALDADDEANIVAGITAVRNANSGVATARAQVGGRQRAFDTADAVAARVKEDALRRQQELVGIEQTDAITELQQAQTAYQAAIQIAQQLPPNGLIGS